MIRIFTDSAASIPAALAQERNIEVITLHVHHNGVNYDDATMDVDEFYADIHSMTNNLPTSSQPSQHTFNEIFESAAAAGDSVLGIFISEKMSGTFEGAVRAARHCKERYEHFKCSIVDSTTNSWDEAFPVFDAADARDAGGDLSDCVHAALEAVKRSRFLFSPETLTFLHAGGRIGAASALVGNLLQLAPVLSVADGETVVLAKVRTQKKVLERMVKIFKEDVEAHGLKRVVVHYIGSSAPARQFAQELLEPAVGHAVDVYPVSPVIGTHVGPAIGFAYECERPVARKFTGDTSTLVFSV